MVAMKGVLPATSPLFVAAVRLIPAGALLVAFAAARGREAPPSAAAWGAVALFGLVDGTLFQGCLAEGLQRTPAGLGSVIIDSQPLTVAVLASLLFGETVTAYGAAGLGLGVLGLCLLEFPPDVTGALLGGDVAGAARGAAALVGGAASAGGGLWDSGEWWMLLAAQSMAVGTVMVPWVCGFVDPVMATGWHMVLGGAPLLAYSWATEPEVYASLGGLSAGDVGALAYTSVLGSAVAYGAFFYFASKGNLTRLSSLTFLTPVFATLFGFAMLGETLTPTQLLGGAVTVAGISLVNLKGEDAEEEAA
mmetsp:Transcript_24778/g.84774  ORF Transcript_24778/g.84774 Transcript_24778/m.84774 type:complete len:306 (+) Transcript_24778:321-1238(+)